jgi:hypothetical protein
VKQIAILVEGQTEEQFVERVLQSYLNPQNDAEGFWLKPIVVMTSRTPQGVKSRGGGGWKHYDRNLCILLAQRHWFRLGLLIDFYALDSHDLLGERSPGERLRSLARDFQNDVELIDDRPQTAPSKRVAAAWPDYSKTVDGIEVVLKVGLANVLTRCPTLREWLVRPTAPVA